MARKDNKGRNLHTGESQRSNGTYMYRYTDERSGRRQAIYAGDLPELRAKKKQLEQDLDDSILTDSSAKKLTVNTLFDNYMETRELAENTRINYIKLWDNHVRDEIGNMKVVQLRSSHVKAFYAKMSRAEYANSTIKAIHMLLYPALELAVDDDIIRKNPAKKAMSSDYGKEPEEKEVLTIDQQKKLFDLIRESNVYNVYVPMFVILLETGLRCGELIGLTWENVDMENRELTVDHQLLYKDWGDGYAFRVSTPKTKAGVRVIPFTENVYRAFLEQRKINFMLGRRSAEEIDGYSNFIFMAKTGRPLMPSAVNNVIYNVVGKYNKEEVIKAKKEHRKAELLPKISVHNFRHTACTNMAKYGMNIKVLQYLMGHANSDVTLDVYNHIGSLQDVREEVERYALAASS